MKEGSRENTVLGPYRVLDLADEKGLLCGMLLGDLGADVIKIEKPGGDAARNTGPFYLKAARISALSKSMALRFACARQLPR